MGKKSIVIVLTVIMLLVLPSLSFGWNNEYVADNYCTNTGGMYTNTYLASWSTNNHYLKYFSGTVQYFDPAPGSWNRASTHKALCNNAWNSYWYLNGSGSQAASYIEGNCMFTFMGHASRYNLALNWGSSYLAISPTLRGDASGDVGYLSNCNNLDDMAFALLLGCHSAEGDNNNVAWYMRCAKGVDTVIGFKTFIWQITDFIPCDGGSHQFAPMHCWNWYFWTYTQAPIFRANVGNSEGAADYWVFYECNNNYWGLDSSDTWGNKSQYIYTPHNGIIEL